MKSVITDGKGKVELKEIRDPQPNSHQCLCRIDACATCTGTDKKLVNGQMAWANKYPAILGHESFGTVIQCGRDVRNIKPGDRFLRPAAAYPWTLLDGYASWMGGFSEYGLVTDTKALQEDNPSAVIHPYCVYQQLIPPEISIEAADATMLVTLKEIASTLRDLDIKFGSKVVVLGTGAVGMSMCYFAKLCGAYPVISVGRRDQPLEDSRKTGADFVINVLHEDMAQKVMEYTQQSGVDFVLDAAGDTGLIMNSGPMLAKYGAICSYAGRTGAEPLAVDSIKGAAHWKYIQGGPDESSAHQYLLDLVRIKAVPLKAFYSHTLPFDEFEAGFQMLIEKQASKIVFTMT
jgi:threonine dehydrogenase-like Zn-dependent dehydrogenase